MKLYAGGGVIKEADSTLVKPLSPKDWLNNWVVNRKDYLKKNLNWSDENINKKLDFYKTKLNLTPENINSSLPSEINGLTRTIKGKSSIEYRYMPEPELRIHELTHATGIIPDVASSIKNITGIGNTPKETVIDVQMPDELYPRLMEMRFSNKLDPTKQYSPEDVQKFRESDATGKNNDLFKYFDNQKISELLNGVAQNKIKTNNKFYS